MKTISLFLISFVISGMIVPALQKGCIRDKSLIPDDETPPTGETVTIPVSLTPVVRLPSVLYESSGIAMTLPGRIWSHNDSGNENEIYCFDTAGTLLRTITISNTGNTDWEDLALDNQKRLYICDVGNNNNDRQDLAIYRIPDPESIAGNSATAEVIRYSYDDQTSFPPPASQRHYDMEAVIWHNDSLFMFTKDRSSPLSGYTRMYKIPAQPGTHIAKYSGRFYIGTTTSAVRVTSADIHTESGKFVLLTYDRLIVFSDFQGSSFLDGKAIHYPFTSLPGQVEAVLFINDSELYITAEGAGGVTGYLYHVSLPD
ncbi:MAG: hypothetical protein R6W67_04710 [Bacteroidales bacterium]